VRPIETIHRDRSKARCDKDKSLAGLRETDRSAFDDGVIDRVARLQESYELTENLLISERRDVLHRDQVRVHLHDQITERSN
jgi:hypothetical protein